MRCWRFRRGTETESALLISLPSNRTMVLQSTSLSGNLLFFFLLVEREKTYKHLKTRDFTRVPIFFFNYRTFISSLKTLMDHHFLLFLYFLNDSVACTLNCNFLIKKSLEFFVIPFSRAQTLTANAKVATIHGVEMLRPLHCLKIS